MRWLGRSTPTTPPRFAFTQGAASRLARISTRSGANSGVGSTSCSWKRFFRPDASGRLGAVLAGFRETEAADGGRQPLAFAAQGMAGGGRFFRDGGVLLRRLVKLRQRHIEFLQQPRLSHGVAGDGSDAVV